MQNKRNKKTGKIEFTMDATETRQLQTAKALCRGIIDTVSAGRTDLTEPAHDAIEALQEVLNAVDPDTAHVTANTEQLQENQ